MANSNSVEKPLLEKIQDLLERKPGNHDVTFCVGKEKKIVRALKVILKASSSFLEKEFEEKWEVAVVKEGDGIPLPDFDPTAFELFVKLSTLDKWSLEILKTLNLSPNQILNLHSICRRFEMTKPVEKLEECAATFMQSFSEYKDTDDFLKLSQANLNFVLGSNKIGIQELDVFHAAIRWAEFQCKEMKVEPTNEKIRRVLGDCLFEIRFPLMTCAEFTKVAEARDILTAEENLGIYRFIGLEATKKLEFNMKKFAFKTTNRKHIVQEATANTNKIKALEYKPNFATNNSQALLPPGVLTLSLSYGCQIMKDPPFVCNGSRNLHFIACKREVTVHGLGFAGPIENDGFFDVKVQLRGIGIAYKSGILKRRIFAEKDKTFYFVFDEPIDLDAGDISGNWNKYYRIEYYLEGANTSSVIKSWCTDSILHGGDAEFSLGRRSNQLAEIQIELC